MDGQCTWALTPAWRLQDVTLSPYLSLGEEGPCHHRNFYLWTLLVLAFLHGWTVFCLLNSCISLSFFSRIWPVSDLFFWVSLPTLSINTALISSRFRLSTEADITMDLCCGSSCTFPVFCGWSIWHKHFIRFLKLFFHGTCSTNWGDLLAGISANSLSWAR